MVETINEFLRSNITGFYSNMLIHLILLLGIAVVSVVSYYITEGVVLLMRIVVDRTRTTWDDDMLNRRFLRALSQLAPALVVHWLLPLFFSNSDTDARWIGIVTRCYILWTIIYILCVTAGNLYHAMARREKLKAYAVKGIFQMVKLVMIIVGVIMTVSILFERSPATILTAIGASAAIMMLVFKDTILGLVASVQLTANKMVRRGDWIIVDKHGANGEVIDVSLTTVKVLNWDNSVTTIPPYSLVSESFNNYEPMRLSGGRRVERAIYIDVNTVGFCSPEQLERLYKNGMITAAEASPEAPRQVNLTLLRSYLERYLSNHPLVRNDMLLMIRQMDAAQSGIPLQLYFFTCETEWKAYEVVQSDIFDHVYASVGEFGLRIFQTPAGTDISRARN